MQEERETTMNRMIWAAASALMLAGCAVAVYPSDTRMVPPLETTDSDSCQALDPMFSPVSGVAVLVQEWQSALSPAADFRRETLTVDGVGVYQVTRIYPNRLPFKTEVVATGSIGLDRFQNLISKAFYREDVTLPRFVDLPSLLEGASGSAALAQTSLTLELKYGRHSVKDEGANNPVFAGFVGAIAQEILSLPLPTPSVMPEASASTASL